MGRSLTPWARSTNLVAGAFRRKMAESGYACEISVPSVTIGTDFEMRYGSGVTCIACQFDFDGQHVSIELTFCKS